MGELKRRMKAGQPAGQPSTGRGTVATVGVFRRIAVPGIDLFRELAPEEHLANIRYANARGIALGLGPLIAVLPDPEDTTA